MYYIYHIPNVKIGVSKNPKTRVRDQGYTNFEILEEHTDINIVSDREIELQIQYGYGRDNNLKYKSTYDNCINMRSYIKYSSPKKSISSKENVKIATKAAVLSGAPGKAGTASGNKIRNCPYCDRSLKGGAAYNNHTKACKKKL